LFGGGGRFGFSANELALNLGWEVIESAVSEAEWVEAPDLFIAEVANTCWKYHKHGNMSLENCEWSIRVINCSHA
jgi:predicted nucleic acid-binding protein